MRDCVHGAHVSNNSYKIDPGKKDNNPDDAPITCYDHTGAADRTGVTEARSKKMEEMLSLRISRINM